MASVSREVVKNNFLDPLCVELRVAHEARQLRCVHQVEHVKTYFFCEFTPAEMQRMLQWNGMDDG